MPLKLSQEGGLLMQDGSGTLFEPLASEKQDEKEALPAYEILTYPADYTLEVLVEKWEKKQITVPTLQRGYVWTQIQASRLIESFLLGLPVPPIFLYQTRHDNSLLVIDGHQRLRTIFYFFSGIFGEPKAKGTKSFTLALNKKSPYFGQTYQSLRDDNSGAFNRLNNSVLRAFIMKQIEPRNDDSIFQVFERLNSGGVALTSQEIRNCLYDGTFNALTQTLNKTPEWRSILGRTALDSRMRDVELVLRLLALLHDLKSYKHPMKKFLNDFIDKHRNLTASETTAFTKQFTETVKAIVRNLGDRPFHVTRGLNVAVCDAVFVAFARHLNRLATKDSGIKDRFKALIKDKDFVVYTTKATTNDKVVPDRIAKAEGFLFGGLAK
jgi:hypothetical protein